MFKKSLKVYKRKKISVVLKKRPANLFDEHCLKKPTSNHYTCLHIFDTATLFISFFHSFFDFLFFNFSKFYFFVCLSFSFKSFETCFDFSAVNKSLQDNFSNNLVKNYRKKPNLKATCPIESDNDIFKERSNQPWSMLGTWLRYLVRLVKCCFFRYVVDAHVYSSNDKFHWTWPGPTEHSFCSLWFWVFRVPTITCPLWPLGMSSLLPHLHYEWTADRDVRVSKIVIRKALIFLSCKSSVMMET